MVIIWVGIRVAFGVDNPLYHVASDSMVPNLNVGDFVIINHNVPFDQLKVGDIIVFKSPEDPGGWKTRNNSASNSEDTN